MKRLFYEERGAATVVEYSIVLPICLFVLMFLYFIGFFLNQKAVLDAAAERGILIAQKVYQDPNAALLMNMGTDSGSRLVGYQITAAGFDSAAYESDPYRYWGGLYKADELSGKIRAKVENAVAANKLAVVDSYVSDMRVGDIVTDSGLLSKTVSITLEQEFHFPLYLGRIGAQPMYRMKSTASVTIVNPTEFVRNVDFAFDVVERLSGVDVAEKLYSMFSKVSKFFTEN